MDFKTWNRNVKDYRNWDRGANPGGWEGGRGASAVSGQGVGSGVDDLTKMGAKDAAKQTFRTAWNANKTIPAGSWMAKEVPGVAGRALDKGASTFRAMAPEIGSAGEAASKAGLGARALGAAGALLNPINPLHATTSVLTAGAQGLNTSTDEYRARMGLNEQGHPDNLLGGDTAVRTLGVFQDIGNNATFGLAGRAGEALARATQGGPLPALPLDPATAAKGKAIAARPAPVAQPIDKAQQQADAMAYGVAADPDGSYAAAEAARFSSIPTSFKQMGPGYTREGNVFTDGSDPTSRISNMNEPWTPEKAATLERVGQMERYNNYLRAGYDPATAQRLMEGKSAQENQVAVIGDPTKKSYRDVAMDMLERSTRMQYGGNMRDAAMDLMGLQQKEDQANAANATEMAKVNAERETGLAKARAGTKEPVSFRDMLAVQQFGLDKQKFDYQQKKDEAEFNRGVTKDKAALSAEQKAAAAKSHEDRMKALFTNPESGQMDQAAVADFNRRAAGFAADLGKNIDQLTSEEFGRLQSLKAMHDLAKDRAGLLFHKGSYKDNADYRAYEPIMKDGKVDVEQGIGGTFIKLRNGSLVNYEDLKKKGGLPILRWFGQDTSPSNYGVDPTTLPQ